MKITKRQLRQIIKEEKAKLINEDAFDNVMRTASQILGPNIELDEEMDGNIIIVADEMDVEANYDQLMAAFPNGEMVEDGFVTGVMQESKISKRQLRQIIKEERAKLLTELSQGERARGLYIDDAMASSVKATLEQMYNNGVNDAIADGEDEMDAEEMVASGITEVLGEFLDSVGFRYMLADRS